MFLVYTVDPIQLIKKSGLLWHLYADDMQIYGVLIPSSTDTGTTE